jgi:hypothetical protein
MPWMLYLREKDLVLVVREAVWAPSLVWMDAEDLVHIGIQSLDHPVCSEFFFY